jgi:hypothetical protein
MKPYFSAHGILPACLLLVTVLSGCNGNPFALGPASQPASPDQDRYTILLTVLNGEDHVQQAVRYKDLTEKEAGWKDLNIVHMENHSELYWGNYASPAQAQENLKAAKMFRTPGGVPVYAQAIVVPVPGKPVGPPELNLDNAPGEYALVVAAFYDVPEANYYGRKQFAVEYCQQLRKQGYEAYYTHGLSQSLVVIGSFPASAVQEEKRPNAPTRWVALDPRLAELQRKFPLLAVNGYSEKTIVVNPKTQKPETVESRSYLLRTHNDQASHANDPFHRTGQ